MAQAIAKNDPDLAPPFDQVFGHLQRTYTRERVEKEVANLLKTPRKALTHNHQVVLRLSKNAIQTPFVVTTNFDLLFERAVPKLRRWVPPLLPVMTEESAQSGIVYLHGRLGDNRQNDESSSGLILGSGDFGRAYLADGWATSFFRQLLERKTVVLLGYSAGDPPIRYLLEGLNASTSAKLQPIYAFDRGEENEVRAKWHDLGVSGIPFSEFNDLWESLEAWAIRADDPDAWRTKTLAMANGSPRTLKPYQRGQITALAATPDGAKMFATIDPPPSAEWLCVLDRNIRYTEPFKSDYSDNAREIDPLAEYGLDDDPPRPIDRNGDTGGVDFLGRLPADTDSDIYFRLSGASPRRRGVIPRRLWSLTRWFENISHEPIALWWASRQLNLHPDLIWGVNRRLVGHGTPFSDDVQRAWSLILEIEEERGDDIHDSGWFDFVAYLKRSGWSSTIYRAFEKAIRPRLKVDGISSSSIPHLVETEELKIERLLRFSVYCPPRDNQEIKISEEALPRALTIINRALERIVNLINDTQRSKIYLRLPAIEPEDEENRRYFSKDGPEALFLWSTSLYKQLAHLDAKAALEETAKWPADEQFFFDQLRLFAWRINEIYDPGVVADGILGIQASSFWNPYLDRDLLHLLRSRWGAFSTKQRRAIEDRLCDPPIELFTDNDPKASENRRRYRMGSRLGWLVRNNCALSVPASKKLAKARANSDWLESFEIRADRDWDGRAGWVERRTDPTSLAGVSVSDLIARSIELSGRDHDTFIEYAPFEGFVVERPAFALASLAIEARNGRYPIEHWKQLLSKWPAEAPLRGTRLCGLRLAALPQDVQIQLSIYATGWIKDHLKHIAGLYPNDFYRVWDRVFDALQSSGPEATASGIGDITMGGQVVQRSRKTLDHAINGSVGNLVGALLALHAQSLKKGEKLPRDVTIRLERSLKSTGEGADHAASLLGERLNWLYYVDTAWTCKVVVPIFHLSNPTAEAAWNGLCFSQTVPQPARLFGLLKDSFLEIFDKKGQWLADDQDEKNAVAVLVVATYWGKNSGRYILDEECRRALQSVGDLGRQAALSTLNSIVSEIDTSWKSFGRRFFATIWPQEARFQTGPTSEAMLRLAENLPNQFPEVVETIKDFLRPIDHPDIYIFRQRRQSGEGRESLAKRWPKQVLDVANRIVPLKPSHVPYELSSLLADIVEAYPTARDTTAYRRLSDLTLRS